MISIAIFLLGLFATVIVAAVGIALFVWLWKYILGLVAIFIVAMLTRDNPAALQFITWAVILPLAVMAVIPQRVLDGLMVKFSRWVK